MRVTSVHTFKDAETYLGPKPSRPMGGHGGSTRLERRDADTIAYRLHSTDVVTFHRDGRIVLNSGGWRTVTTKARISDAARLRLYSAKGAWFFIHNGRTYSFADGVTLKGNRVTGAGPSPDKEAARVRKLRARIKRFVSGYMAALVAGKIPAPSAGDCLICQCSRPEPVDAASSRNGKIRTEGPNTIGFGGSGHIESHLSEKYYVPSLISNAAAAFGVSPAAKQYLASWWDASAPPDQAAKVRQYWGDIATRQLRSALRRYLSRQLGLSC